MSFNAPRPTLRNVKLTCTMKPRFSQRHGYVEEPPITIREDAPGSIRAALLPILTDNFNMQYKDIREIICPILHTFPDANNWSEIPNVRNEVVELIRECPWYRFYDICEAIYKHWDTWERGEEFAELLNALFREYGVGWQMRKGQIVTRGPKDFERTVTKAKKALREAGYETAKSELEEARLDLSRRPKPDVTGAIQHSVAALECVAREMTDSKETLGQILKKQAAQLGIPKPLDDALGKIWGYASEKGRHLKEGDEPERREAELVLMLASATIAYLLEEE